MAKYKVEINGWDTNKLHVLKNEEMIPLFEELKQGNKEARNILIQGNLKLVLSLVQRFSGRLDNLDDLFQIGCVGLMKAIDNFDCSFDVRFSTYAVPMILGEMRRYLRDNQAYRVSRHLKDISFLVSKEKEDYFNKYQKEPSIDYLSSKLGIDRYELCLALESTRTPVSLFEPVFQDDGECLYVIDQVIDNKNEEEVILNAISLKKGLEQLSGNQAKIIKKRYYDDLTQTEIANELSVSQAQVSRMEKNALEELKKYF